MLGNKLFWKEWLERMPKNLIRFGVTDDQGLLSFGNSYHWENSWNFTNLKCVFHPNHEGRAEHRGSFNKDVEMDITRAGLPTKKLEL